MQVPGAHVSSAERRVHHARRRALVVFGAAAGLGPLSLARTALGAGREAEPLYWRGSVLGGDASLALLHPDKEKAERAIGLLVAELHRLERIFSLYRPDSALVLLNREGELAYPPFELLQVLQKARYWFEVSDGAFDISVQPLWNYYAGLAGRQTNPAEFSTALALVDGSAISLKRSKVAFEKKGMALTLNGIAQGTMTDRVSTLLREEGFENLLLNMGEISSSGLGPSGKPWRIALEDAGLTSFPLLEKAIASSSNASLCVPGGGRLHHLFDPKSGLAARKLRSAHVIGPSAEDADAAATALLAGGPDLAGKLLASGRIERALLGTNKGWTMSAPDQG